MRRLVPVKWGTGLMHMLTRSKDLTTKHQIQGGAGRGFANRCQWDTAWQTLTQASSCLHLNSF